MAMPTPAPTLDRRALASWAGSVGPALFVVVFTIEGWLRPGYDARRMFISELALGPRGFIQDLNFIVLGALFLVFARGVASAFGQASRVGPILLAIIGMAFLGSGFCVMDPVATPRDHLTAHGVLHGILGALVFTLSPASCFVFLRRFRDDPRWRPLRGWTRAAGTIVVIAVALQAVATKPPLAPNALSEWAGALQRTALITYLAWVGAFAGRLRRKHATGTGVSE